MSIPKMSALTMSTPKMSTLVTSAVPKCLLLHQSISAGRRAGDIR